MRAAIIGLGQIAWRYDGGLPQDGAALTHLATLRQADLDILGGADPMAQAREDFSGATGLPSFADLGQVLDQSPDLVTIASPNAVHADHLAACLDAGVKYIWLEKPATTDPAQTLALAEQADRLGARVLVGFQRRYMPSYQALMRGDLGQLTGAEVTYSRGLETNGAHMVDLILALLGDQLPDVAGVVAGPAVVECAEPCPSFLLAGPGGVPIAVLGQDLSYHSIDIAAHYTGGRRAVRHGGQSTLAEVKTPNPLFPGFHYLASDLGAQDVAAEVGAVFPAMLADLMKGAAPQPLSNLRSAGLGQQIVTQVLGRCA